MFYFVENPKAGFLAVGADYVTPSFITLCIDK